MFLRQVLKQQTAVDLERFPWVLMPATSPTATLPLAEKIKQWRRIVNL
jgi:hypothetical protein